MADIDRSDEYGCFVVRCDDFDNLSKQLLDWNSPNSRTGIPLPVDKNLLRDLKKIEKLSEHPTTSKKYIIIAYYHYNIEVKSLKTI